MTTEDHAKALLAKMSEDALPVLVKQIEEAKHERIRLHYDPRVEVFDGEDQAT